MNLETLKSDVQKWNKTRPEKPDLFGAELSDADLSGANLSGADLSRVYLRCANLYSANLYSANLSGTNLSGANLRYADLYCADLFNTKCLPTAQQFFQQFENEERGLIVFRVQKGYYPHPDHWTWAPGATLKERIEPDRRILCAAGISFATKAWLEKNFPNKTIWKCRIPWRALADAVVPFATDGKARCSELEILEEISE